VPEQNEVAKRETDERMLEKARPYVVKFFQRVLAPTMSVVFISVCATMAWKFGLGEWNSGLLLGGLAFNTFGAGIVVFGAVPKKSIAIEMCKTKYGYNAYFLGELLKNRLSAQFGIGFILLGFLLLVAEQALQQVFI